MAKIVNLWPVPDARFSHEKRYGYNVVLPEMIALFFEYMRGIGPDAFIVKIYQDDHTTHEIMRGCVPTEAYDRIKIREAQISLEAELDVQSIDAAKSIKGRVSRIYQNRNHGNDVVFVKCKDGIVGCGWYDSAHTVRKGLKMAAFMLYALGSLNGPTDETLLTAVYNYLPYDSELTSAEADKASEFIVRVVGKQAADRVTN